MLAGDFALLPLDEVVVVLRHQAELVVYVLQRCTEKAPVAMPIDQWSNFVGQHRAAPLQLLYSSVECWRSWLVLDKHFLVREAD